MDSGDQFQGVLCCHLQNNVSALDALGKLLDLKASSIHNGITCLDLQLKNKYYRTTVHLFDYNDSIENSEETLANCQAIILVGDGMKLTVEMMDEKIKLFEDVQGEPRILLCDNIDEDCEPHKTILNWCIENKYDLILSQSEDARSRLIDSLSAYKWRHRLDKAAMERDERPKLNDEVIKKLVEFDNLLGKLSEYRDKPELRGNSDDKNIMEIAELLSGLVGEDVDGFLDNEEQLTNNHEKEVTPSEE